MTGPWAIQSAAYIATVCVLTYFFGAQIASHYTLSPEWLMASASCGGFVIGAFGKK